MWYFASGDSGFYFAEQLKQLGWLPEIWRPEYGSGISTLARMWFDYPYLFIVKLLSSAGLNWWVIDKLMWAFALAILIFSVLKLSRVLSLTKLQTVASSIVYCTNTYILLLFGGGQVGVAMAYGLAPLVLANFIEVFNRETERAADIKSAILNGLWLALLVTLDLRLACLVVGAGLLYAVISNWNNLYKNASRILLPVVVAVLVHSFWILPLAVVRGGGLADIGGEYTGPGMLKFLSFADFSHAITLLHPNWPDNLFGKVYFLQPEFLAIPILAFAALLFIHKGKERKVPILFFALLTIIGAFFAKGVNPPVGEVFQWMYLHIPGFIMFRDPTKFYLFIALGYAVIIPYSLQKIGAYVGKFRWIIYVAGLLFWCFTIRPVFLGQLSGNFKPPVIPEEYIQLKDVLVRDGAGSRMLWMPAPDKFVYLSSLHPVWSAQTLFANASVSGLITLVGRQEFRTVIHDAGIKYIIVPMDIEKRIFMSGYKYNDLERRSLIKALTAAGFTKVSEFEHIALFTNPSYLFTANKPAILARQEYWVKIGFAISVISILIFGYLSLSSFRMKKVI